MTPGNGSNCLWIGKLCAIVLVLAMVLPVGMVFVGRTGADTGEAFEDGTIEEVGVMDDSEHALTMLYGYVVDPFGAPVDTFVVVVSNPRNELVNYTWGERGWYEFDLSLVDVQEGDLLDFASTDGNCIYNHSLVYEGLSIRHDFVLHPDSDMPLSSSLDEGFEDPYLSPDLDYDPLLPDMYADDGIGTLHRPDLRILDISLDQWRPVQGEMVEVHVAVTTTTLLFEPYEVAFYMEEQDPGSMFELVWIDPRPGKVTTTLTIRVETGVLEGLHRLLVVADPYDNIEERDKENNKMDVVFTVLTMDYLMETIETDMDNISNAISETSLHHSRKRVLNNHLSNAERSVDRAHSFYKAGNIVNSVLYANQAVHHLFLFVDKMGEYYINGELTTDEYMCLVDSCVELAQHVLEVPLVVINQPEARQLYASENLLLKILRHGWLEQPANTAWSGVAEKLVDALECYQKSMENLARNQEYDGLLDEANLFLEAAAAMLEEYMVEGLIDPLFAETVLDMLLRQRLVFPPNLDIGRGDIWMSGEYVAGSSQTLATTIRNHGWVTARDVLVRASFRLREFGESTREVQAKETLYTLETTIPLLLRDEETTINWEWTPATEGTYITTIEIDPDNTILEIEKENNMALYGSHITSGSIWWEEGHTIPSGVTETYYDKTIHLIEGNLLIEQGGRLVLVNTTLQVHPVDDDPIIVHASVIVEDGGVLEVLDNSIVSTPSWDVLQKVLISGDLTVKDSTFQYMWGDEDQYVGGIQLLPGSTGLFENADIYEGYTHNIYMNASNALFINGTNNDAGASGTGNGIHAVNGSAPIIIGSSFADPAEDGIGVYNGLGRVEGATIMNAGRDGISLQDGGLASATTFVFHDQARERTIPYPTSGGEETVYVSLPSDAVVSEASLWLEPVESVLDTFDSRFWRYDSGGENVVSRADRVSGEEYYGPTGGNSSSVLGVAGDDPPMQQSHGYANMTRTYQGGFDQISFMYKQDTWTYDEDAQGQFDLVVSCYNDGVLMDEYQYVLGWVNIPEAEPAWLLPNHNIIGDTPPAEWSVFEGDMSVDWSIDWDNVTSIGLTFRVLGDHTQNDNYTVYIDDVGVSASSVPSAATIKIGDTDAWTVDLPITEPIDITTPLQTYLATNPDAGLVPINIGSDARGNLRVYDLTIWWTTVPTVRNVEIYGGDTGIQGRGIDIRGGMFSIQNNIFANMGYGIYAVDVDGRREMTGTPTPIPGTNPGYYIGYEDGNWTITLNGGTETHLFDWSVTDEDGITYEHSNTVPSGGQITILGYTGNISLVLYLDGAETDKIYLGEEHFTPPGQPVILSVEDGTPYVVVAVVSGNLQEKGICGLYLENGSHVMVVGNEMSLNQEFGVLITGSSNITVRDNVFLENSDISSGRDRTGSFWYNIKGHGVLFQETDNNVVINNTAIGNGFSGIILTSSNGNKVIDNVATGAAYGIYLSESEANIIRDNDACANKQTIVLSSVQYGYGIYLYLSHGNILEGNNVTLNFVEGMVFDYSNNNMVINNDVSSNTWPAYVQERFGVYISSSNNNWFENNTVSHNWHGIGIVQSNGNWFENITIFSSIGVGFYAFSSSHNTIANSSVSRNVYGFLFSSSDHNHLENNTIRQNQHGIYLLNSWDNRIMNNSNSVEQPMQDVVGWEYQEGVVIVGLKDSEEDRNMFLAYNEKFLGARIEKDYTYINMVELLLDENMGVFDAIAELETLDFVRYAEPDYKVQFYKTPDDPLYGDGSLWGLDKISVPDAWDISTGSRDVVVAVIDTGVDYTHSDLQANMWTDPETNTHGYNSINNSLYPMDYDGHGTHVAGTIGAVGNNSLGVVGVNWNVSIMALTIGYISGVVDCLDFVLANSENVVATSNSYGGYPYSHAMYDAIQAHRDAGILFITSAGNGASDNDVFPMYPASYNLTNIISVAASDQNDGLAGFSCYGPNSVHVAAPGVGILSTVPGDDYASNGGTSMAAPHVSGLAALLKSANEDLGMVELKNIILSGADMVSHLDGEIITGGRINASRSMSHAITPPSEDVWFWVQLWGGYTGTVGQGKDIFVTVTDGVNPITGASVTVSFSTGEETLVLLDDGHGVDQVANDGYYSGTWIPRVAGEVVLNITVAHAGHTYHREYIVNISYYHTSISLIESHNNLIWNNTITGLIKKGVVVYQSNHNTVAKNNITNMAEKGILVYESEWNNISNNTLVGNNIVGILMNSSNNTNIIHNKITESVVGVYTANCEKVLFHNNTLADNNYALYSNNSSLQLEDNNVLNNTFGLLFNNSNVTMFGNLLSNPAHLVEAEAPPGSRIFMGRGYNLKALDSTIYVLDNNTFADSLYGIVANNSQIVVENSTFTDLQDIRVQLWTWIPGMWVWNPKTYDWEWQEGWWSVSNSYSGYGISTSHCNLEVSESRFLNNYYDIYSVLETATIEDNVFTGIPDPMGNDGAVMIWNNTKTTIANNTISQKTSRAIRIGGTVGDSMVFNNTIFSTGRGIELLETQNAIIRLNTIENSTEYGIWLNNSHHNTIYHNNIIDNTVQAYDDGTNNWDMGDPATDGLGGNYWSDWPTTDPRPISGGTNQDDYPWIEQDGWT